MASGKIREMCRLRRSDKIVKNSTQNKKLLRFKQATYVYLRRYAIKNSSIFSRKCLIVNKINRIEVLKFRSLGFRNFQTINRLWKSYIRSVTKIQILFVLVMIQKFFLAKYYCQRILSMWDNIFGGARSKVSFFYGCL